MPGEGLRIVLLSAGMRPGCGLKYRVGWVSVPGTLFPNQPLKANPTADPKPCSTAEGGTGGPGPGSTRGLIPCGRKEGRKERERERERKRKTRTTGVALARKGWGSAPPA